MKDRKYWQDRFIQLETAQNQKGMAVYGEVEKQYRLAQREIEGKINTWYQRFADNNCVSMAEARRMLSGADLKEFKWDVNDYIRHGEENALNGEWMRELENASARYHINRLEALKIQTQQSLEAMFGNQLDCIDRAMRDIYIDGYYHTAFELQKGVGLGWNLSTLDDRKIEKVIKRPWAVDGKNFSERIWQNRNKLIRELHTELTRSIITGADPQKAIDAIARKLNTSKHNAGRLIMTEQAFFSSAAQKDCFAELDVDQYEIVATLDSHTSEICREMDGRHFKMSEWETGVTAPPFHVWCRSASAPYFEDNFGQVGERAARGEDGKTYYVPADMTYKDWKKTFSDGGDKTGLSVVDHKGMRRPEKTGYDKSGFMNITKKWTATKGKTGTVIEKQEYAVNGVVYKTDGKHVVLRPTGQERAIASVLSEKYGKKVEFVPQIMYPQGIQTPDYMIDGVRFDLKSPAGSGKNMLYSMVNKKSKQSPNFIFDITDCPLSEEEIERQIKGLYYSRHTKFVEKIVVVKNREIFKVYDRK